MYASSLWISTLIDGTAEEIKNASETLPKAIMTGVVINGCLGFLMVVTLCFTLGDVTQILATPTLYPFIQIFYNATQSFAATDVMTTIVIITLTSSVISEIATSSRQLWSFARDGGLPFSGVITVVSHHFCLSGVAIPADHLLP
jgi:amino acid transporter